MTIFDGKAPVKSTKHATGALLSCADHMQQNAWALPSQAFAQNATWALPLCAEHTQHNAWALPSQAFAPNATWALPSCAEHTHRVQHIRESEHPSPGVAGRPAHHIHTLCLKALRIHKSIINYLIIINTSYLLLSYNFLHSGHACCPETQKEIYRTLKTSSLGRRRIRRSYRGIPLSQLQGLAHTVKFYTKGGTSPPNSFNKNHIQLAFKSQNKLDISVNKRAGEP